MQDDLNPAGTDTNMTFPVLQLKSDNRSAIDQRLVASGLKLCRFAHLPRRSLSGKPLVCVEANRLHPSSPQMDRPCRRQLGACSHRAGGIPVYHPGAGAVGIWETRLLAEKTGPSLRRRDRSGVCVADRARISLEATCLMPPGVGRRSPAPGRRLVLPRGRHGRHHVILGNMSERWS